MSIKRLFCWLSFYVDYWLIYLTNKTVGYMIDHDYTPDEIDRYIENLIYGRWLKKQARKQNRNNPS